jgi:hypothetical protein
MLIGFHRGLAIPLWAVAFGFVALSAPPRLTPTLIALLGIAAIGATMPAIVRRLRTSHPQVEVLPAVDQDSAPAGIMIAAGMRTRTLGEVIGARTAKTDDAADLVRMDDDGGWQDESTSIETTCSR